ncbi:MAG: DNA repair protein RadC [Flavobacteriales bacterium]|nr:DNA repair protein RadC [Flavobacteriales bacterium]
MEDIYAFRGIKALASEDRPREKLVALGKSNLSDAELLAILLGSGTREMSAVELARVLLEHCNNHLVDLGKASIHELMRIKGIGEAKAITVIAALELARRRDEAVPVDRSKISSSSDAYRIVKPKLADLAHEEFWIIILSRSNRVKRTHLISKGGIAGTVVDVRMIFAEAMARSASALILAHNHPSGNLTPSEQDIRLTKKLTEAGKILDIPVLDHIIASENGYFSFADESML